MVIATTWHRGWSNGICDPRQTPVQYHDYLIHRHERVCIAYSTTDLSGT